MYFIEMRFGKNKARAPEFMDAHKAWLKQGLEEGVFLVAGSLDDASGGAILSSIEDKEAMTAYLAADPFVAEGVVVPVLTGFSAAFAHEAVKSLV